MSNISVLPQRRWGRILSNDMACGRRRVRVAATHSLCTAALFVAYLKLLPSVPQYSIPGARSLDPVALFMPDPYGPDDVVRTLEGFMAYNPPSLLTFDPATGNMETYIAPSETKVDGRWPAFMLSRALFLHFPNRFTADQPPFQLLFTATDYPRAACLADEGGCSEKAFAPLLAFGSVPRDPGILPTAVAMPFPPLAECLLKDCHLLSSMVDDARSDFIWADLLPQMFWRGSDEDNFHNQFGLGLGHGGDFGLDLSNAGSEEIGNRLLDLWDVLTPRWRAVASSMIARVDAEKANRDREEEGDGPAILPWIEAKFTLGRTPPLSKPKDENFGRFLEMGSPVVTSDHVPHSDMMQYRYHLDLVGGGSTTWADTLRKLAMPGLLFHHETLMRDWFYGELQPWVHYVPIRIDLNDLSDKYVWAETNPIEAETIARNGREFVLEMATDEYKKRLYKNLFVDQLRPIVGAYRPVANAILAPSGHELGLYSTCNAEACTFNRKDPMPFNDVDFDYMKDYSWLVEEGDGAPAADFA